MGIKCTLKNYDYIQDALPLKESNPIHIQSVLANSNPVYD